MQHPAVLFDRVWKKFRRGERHDSLRDLIPALIGKAVRPAATELGGDEFWVLQDASFTVEAGQAMGIIGPNGAGKSTTLKLLTRLLRPDQGTCAVQGRVGALIEIAAGFHPDLTGRENIFLQGSIMGMKRLEIAKHLDDIIEFAGVSSFIDTPVKRYSSGMNARLGFAIAAHLNPDVLLIDEVLGVGDTAFQAKCVERMRQFKKAGVAIAFVSHNLQAVAELCDSAILLRGGRIQDHGDSQSVLASYVRSLGTSTTTSSSGPCQIVDATLTDRRSAPVSLLSPGDALRLRVRYQSTTALRDLTFGFYLRRSTDQLMVFDGNINEKELGLDGLEPGQPRVVDFFFNAHLTRGQYHLGLHVFHNPTQRFVARMEPAGIFSVAEERSIAGVADIGLQASLSPSASLAVPLA